MRERRRISANFACAGSEAWLVLVVETADVNSPLCCSACGPFVEQISHISKAQRKTDVQQYRHADNLTARFEIAKLIRIAHPVRLRNHLARLKRFCSDSAPKKVTAQGKPTFMQGATSGSFGLEAGFRCAQPTRLHSLETIGNRFADKIENKLN